MKELKPDFSKLIDPESGTELLPAIVQDNSDSAILMVGFMNKEAYQKTIDLGKVTFWSRTRKTIWTKGETSGNYLGVVSMQLDCDDDTLLIKAQAYGPTCHRPRMRSCFDS
jgi:phosphoribosyl-ATP pyrophosphohydrolase/phosphoribosyl-AMP cyclohydrolase